MPTIKRFSYCRIEIRPRDHKPPHFHVVLADGRDCLVEIDTLDMIGPVRAEEIIQPLEWARENKQLLMEEWEKWHR
jgi:hypothetical protein